MRLDLTGKKPLSGAHAELLDKISAANRSEYASFINAISVDYADNIDWWVTPFACRNTYASDTFLNCCKLELAKTLLNEGKKIEQIIVSSKGMRDALCGIIADRNFIDIKLEKSFTDRISDSFRPIYNILATIYHITFQLFWARVYPKKHSSTVKDGIILIDTFLYEDSATNDDIKDRHYPGLEEYLHEQERARIKYLPTFYKIRNYRNTIKAVRKQSEKYILKEDYLRINDYLYALLHSIRIRTFRKRAYLYRDNDITSLVNEDFYTNTWAYSSVEALLKYRLARRMAECSVNISCYIDWYENQEIDHGLNAGMRKYYPAAKSVGYQGYHAAKNYLSMFPIEQEYKSKVIPYELMVIGKGLIEEPKEFCQDILVATAPALRQMRIHKKNPGRANNKGEYSILVALPAVQTDYLRIINLLKDINQRAAIRNYLQLNNVQFLLKLHPSITGRAMYDVREMLEHSGIRLADRGLYEHLDSSNLFVSTASGTCLEALGKGIPVIIVGSDRGLTYNPVPADVPKQMWRICFTENTFIKAIKEFIDCNEERNNNYIENGKQIRKKYFEPVTRTNIVKFLKLDVSKSIKTIL